MVSRNFVALGVLGAVAFTFGCGSSRSDSGSAGAAGVASSVGGSSTAGSAGNGGASAGTGGSVSTSGGTGGTNATAGAGGDPPDQLLGPMPCSDEAELGASAASSGARTVTTGAMSKGNTAASIGFSATDVDATGNAVLWARYSGATAFRTFGSVPPPSKPGDTGFGDGVSSQAAFTAACQKLADSPTTSTLISLKDIESYIASGKAAGVVPMAAAVNAPLVVEIKTRADTIPLDHAPTSAADWNANWAVWKNYFAVAFVYARDFGITHFEIYNEPDLHTSPTDAFSSVADYTIRARLAGDAIQRGIAAASVARKAKDATAESLVPMVIAPTSATGSHDWGKALVSEINAGPLGASVANYTLFQGYGYHSYNSDGASAVTTVRNIQSDVLAPTSLTLPWFITEFNASDNADAKSSLGNDTYALDLPDYSRRLVEKAIGYTEADVGPMNLYAFNFLSTDDAGVITNNGLYWATDGSVVGGDSVGAAAYRLLIQHFGAGQPRVDLTVGKVTADGTKAPDTLCEATYDARSDVYFIITSNRAAATQKVFFDLGSLALPAGTVATTIDVDATHHGEVTHRFTLSAASTFELTQQPNAVTLVSVPRSHGTLASVGAAADTTLAPGAQSGTRFGTDMTLALAADSTNTSKLRTALLAFQLPAISETIGEGVLELSLTPDSKASTGADVIHVYGVPDTAWTDDATTGERWSDVANLRALTDGSKYGAIEDNAIQFAPNGKLDSALRIAGTALVSNGLLRVDITNYLREQAALGHARVSLLLVREVNHHSETIAYSAAFRSRESTCGGPSLTLRYFR